MLQPNDTFPRSDNRARRGRASTAGRERLPSGEFVSISRVQEHPHGLARYYDHLLQELGPQGWWPARTRLEVILGAILTQNTNWQNAARALTRLRKQRLLALGRLRALSESELRDLIRPAGFFIQKARAIRGFLDWLDAAHAGSLDRMFAVPAEQLRPALLALKGVGPETADAILLYAGDKPFFVADAYTRRILERHGLLPADGSYEEAQQFIHRELEREAAVYNEFHALLVEVGKRYCGSYAMKCQACPLQDFLPGRPGEAQAPPPMRYGRDARALRNSY